jgi:ACS family tartrate transporter-like MFS transporter
MSSTTKSDSPPPNLAAILRKAAWRLLPFLGLLYLLNILDRVNVGFARLTMKADLNLSQDVFDIGFGIFYFGYLLFEVPANLLLRRIGARRWIARIMVTWGLVTCGTMFVTGPWSFYAVRILLGVAEAGFFPGIVLYLTFWFPSRQRARAMAVFMVASSLAGVLGNPISGAAMHYLNGVAGLAGWQWLFLVEGLPAVLVGVTVLWLLPDGPDDARWMSPAESRLLQEALAADGPAAAPQSHSLRSLLHRRVWHLILIYFTVAVGTNAMGAYLPKLLETRFPEQTKLGLGFLSALPHVAAMVAMILMGMNSDRMGERRLHVAASAWLAVAGWGLNLVAPSPWLALLGLCLAQAGMMSMLPTFWAIPTAFLRGAAAAGGIALINSVANLGGLMGPIILGRLGVPAMMVTLFAGGALALMLRMERDSK